MRKTLSFLLAVLLVVSMAPAAFAENATPGSTTLTTTVPAATYTLNIPADTTIPFGAESTSIGNLTVTDSSGFAEGKNLAVTVEYGEFTSKNVSTTIPYTLIICGLTASDSTALSSGKVLPFKGQSNGEVKEQALYANKYISSMEIEVKSANWGKALGGDYSSLITFTAEVVVED